MAQSPALRIGPGPEVFRSESGLAAASTGSLQRLLDIALDLRVLQDVARDGLVLVLVDGLFRHGCPPSSSQDTGRPPRSSRTSGKAAEPYLEVLTRNGV